METPTVTGPLEGLVGRLRKWAEWLRRFDMRNPEVPKALDGAADEIERLQAERDALLESCQLARWICEPDNALQQKLDAAIARATGQPPNAGLSGRDTKD